MSLHIHFFGESRLLEKEAGNSDCPFSRQYGGSVYVNTVPPFRPLFLQKLLVYLRSQNAARDREYSDCHISTQGCNYYGGFDHACETAIDGRC